MATASDALNALMKRDGLSQGHVSRKSGVPQPAISDIAMRGRDPKAATLTKLELAFPDLVQLRLGTAP